MGNPRCVIQVDNVDTAAVETLGPVLESHERFPERANIGFMRVVRREAYPAAVYERGAGETRACGSGARALPLPWGFSRGLLAEEEVRDGMPAGGRLVALLEDSGHFAMTGPARRICDGCIHL